MAVLLGSTESLKELAGKMYDYIVDVTIKQGRLLPMRDLYGDGSRWKHERNLFKSVYESIKELLKNVK